MGGGRWRWGRKCVVMGGSGAWRWRWRWRWGVEETMMEVEVEMQVEGGGGGSWWRSKFRAERRRASPPEITDRPGVVSSLQTGSCLWRTPARTARRWR